jgi:phage terminase large subunit
VSQNQIKIPQKHLDAFRTCVQGFIFNLVFFGGRGSAKSESVARLLLHEATRNPLRILCCREIQNSIEDSVYALLERLINENEHYQKFFTLTKTEITGINGSSFRFKGLKKETVGSVKSVDKVDICWIEEAQFISRHSLDTLMPTIRDDGSLVIFTMNPTNDDDPVYVDYVLTERADTVRCEVNIFDNPFRTKRLINDMEWDKAHDIDKYNHIWLGQTVKHSDAQIFKGRWIIDDFKTPEYVDFYHGIDWGFANDPNVLVRCFIDKGSLYIDQEVGRIQMQLEDIPFEFDTIPTFHKWGAIADNARPETISFMQNKGYNIRACTKWAGCVEDRIEIVKGAFERIVIHARCKETAYEFRNYSYKTDRLTGKILPIIVDKNNHYIDAIFYALDDIIRNNGQSVIVSDGKVRGEIDKNYIIQEERFKY